MRHISVCHARRDEASKPISPTFYAPRIAARISRTYHRPELLLLRQPSSQRLLGPALLSSHCRTSSLWQVLCRAILGSSLHPSCRSRLRIAAGAARSRRRRSICSRRRGRSSSFQLVESAAHRCNSQPPSCRRRRLHLRRILSRTVCSSQPPGCL